MATKRPGRRRRQYTLRMEQDLREAIDREAARERRPIANLIRNALRDRFCAQSAAARS